jgi:chaperone modulatory protein CbpM
LITFHRAQQLHHELALDWPGIAVTLTLLEEIEQLRKENSQLHQRLARFVTRP